MSDEPRIVIACYKPHPGQSEALRELIRDHVATVRVQGLVTDRVPITMEARDGTVVEVFEWVSDAAIKSAHDNPAVQAMWQDYAQVCDHMPIGEVPEVAELFSEFAPGRTAPRSDRRNNEGEPAWSCNGSPSARRARRPGEGRSRHRRC